MDKHELLAWEEFTRTGRIDAYLSYRRSKMRELNFEAGDEIGIDQNGRNSDKRN